MNPSFSLGLILPNKGIPKCKSDIENIRLECSASKMWTRILTCLNVKSATGITVKRFQVWDTKRRYHFKCNDKQFPRCGWWVLKRGKFLNGIRWGAGQGEQWELDIMYDGLTQRNQENKYKQRVFIISANWICMYTYYT